MENRIKARKQVFNFIVRIARGSHFNGGISNLEKFASVLDVPVEHLNDLKEGKADPSGKLVNQFRSLFGSALHKDDIDQYFVKPFEQEEE